MNSTNRPLKPYPAAERLRLAVLILNDIPPQSVVDDSASWTEEDLQEYTQRSWQHIDQQLEDRSLWLTPAMS